MAIARSPSLCARASISSWIRFATTFASLPLSLGSVNVSTFLAFGLSNVGPSHRTHTRETPILAAALLALFPQGTPAAPTRDSVPMAIAVRAERPPRIDGHDDD